MTLYILELWTKFDIELIKIEFGVFQLHWQVFNEARDIRPLLEHPNGVIKALFGKPPYK